MDGNKPVLRAALSDASSFSDNFSISHVLALFLAPSLSSNRSIYPFVSFFPNQCLTFIMALLCLLSHSHASLSLWILPFSHALFYSYLPFLTNSATCHPLDYSESSCQIVHAFRSIPSYDSHCLSSVHYRYILFYSFLDGSLPLTGFNSLSFSANDCLRVASCYCLMFVIDSNLYRSSSILPLPDGGTPIFVGRFPSSFFITSGRSCANASHMWHVASHTSEVTRRMSKVTYRNSHVILFQRPCIGIESNIRGIFRGRPH